MALVEFALVLPILVAVVFGTIDLGRAYELQNRLDGAAHEGGQYAQFFPCDITNVVLHAQNEGGTAAPDTSLIVTEPNVDCRQQVPPPGASVLVNVAATFTPLTPLISIQRLSGSATVVVQG